MTEPGAATRPSSPPARLAWVLSFMLIAVALIGAGLGYYALESRRLEHQKKDEIAGIAAAKIAQIERWRQERLWDVRRLTMSPFVREHLEAWLDAPTRPGLRERLQARLDVEPTIREHVAVFILGLDGRILLASSGSTVQAIDATTRAVLNAAATSGAALGDMYKGGDRSVRIDAVSAFRDERGHVIAFACFVSDASEYLFPMLGLWPTASHNAETQLVRRDGEAALFLNGRRDRPGSAMTAREPLTDTWSPAVRAVLGQVGPIRNRDDRGVEVLADVRPVPGTAWSLVSKLDASEVFSELRLRAGLVGFAVVLLVALAGIGTAFGYRRQLAVEHRQADEADKLLAQRRGLHIDQTPLAVIEWDMGFCVSEWNPAAERIFGYAKSEAVGRHASFILPDTVKAHVGEIWKALISQTGGTRSSNDNVHRDGRVIHCEWFNTPLVDAAGKVFGAASLVQDITARVEWERALQAKTEALDRSNRELQQFAYVASHDLQEPLRMVASYTALLAEEYRGKLGEEADRYIHYAVDGAKRMQALINDLLVLARVETKAKPPQVTAAATAVQVALDNLEAAIHESGATVEIGDLPVLPMDRSQIAQVFQNLVGNAIKFRRDVEPHVEIGAEPVGASWVFHVRDNGIGFDPRQSERVFQMFQRLHAREQYSGSGIGLAIVKKIIERHGGRVWVDAVPGEGACFYFSLPAALPPAART